MPDTVIETPAAEARAAELAVTGGQAAADLRRAAHMLRESVALLPPGPWFTWLYEGMADEDVEPEWAIRAGSHGQHVIIRARTSHTTAIGHLSQFSPEVAHTLAEQFEQAATRAQKTLGETWTPGDVGLLHIAREYLAALGPRAAGPTPSTPVVSGLVSLKHEQHGTIGLYLGKHRVGAVWGPAADRTGEWFAALSQVTGAVELPAWTGRAANRAAALVALLNAVGFDLGGAV
jgi:hypothetical protein